MLRLKFWASGGPVRGYFLNIANGCRGRPNQRVDAVSVQYADERLFRRPLGVTGENPVYVSHFVNDEDSERETDNA